MNERKTKPQKQPLPSTPKEKPEKPTPKPRVVGVEAPAMDGYFIMERNIVSKKVFCPLLNKEVEEGYCWELCNIANDDILLEGDTVKDWDNAQKICRDCGRYE